MNSNRSVKRTLHRRVPNQSPTRFVQRPSPSQPPLPRSLLSLPGKRRTKATRSWQSSRLDAYVHAHTYNTCWIWLVSALREWVCHFFPCWLFFLWWQRTSTQSCSKSQLFVTCRVLQPTKATILKRPPPPQNPCSHFPFTFLHSSGFPEVHG